MIGQRLRQLRLARNMSLDSLAANMGGIVTKQALSKYEHGKAKPSPIVLSKLATTLGVNASYFFSEPSIKVKFIAYRKSPWLLEKDRGRIKSFIEQELEERVRILDLIGQESCDKLPIGELPVKCLDDAEDAAYTIRNSWELGLAPIANVTTTIEGNLLSVMSVETNDEFDGVSAIVYDNEDCIKTIAIVTRRGISGERQRLNLTHELGHLVLDIAEDVDEERAAFRFGTAFLAPASKIFKEIGEKRALIQLEELLYLKRQFGLSIQALVHRLKDLSIITDSYYAQWFTKINKYGWKKKEPEEWRYEESSWLRRNVLRLIAEGLISQVEAERILKEKLELEQPVSVVERRAFIRLPLEKRRQILEEQARKVVTQYEQELEWRDLQGGDIVEY